MNNLKIGISRVDCTPMLGIDLAGYFKTRFAQGVLDPLEINAMAISAGGETAIIITIDHLGIKQEIMDIFRRSAAQATGLSYEAIFICATHTHTAPKIDEGERQDLIDQYRNTVCQKITDAAVMAMEDLKDARMGHAIGCAPNIAFMRRFRMKDGSVRTNPGVGNPDILAPLCEVDQRVNVLRFDREGAKSVVLVNFGNHPDTVGGSKISADWPGLMRKTLERCIPNTNVIFVNGAQGDVNHVNVNAKGGDMNDMFIDFDDVARGYGHARHMGNVVAGAVMQVYDKVAYKDIDRIRYMQKTINVPSNMPSPEDMAQAHKINDLHVAGKDSEIPFVGMELTTVVAEAGRMVALEHGSEAFPMYISALAIGNTALIGIPGEPFTGIGTALKQCEGWDLILPCCLTNGSEGYFPMNSAYDEGGYEARSSRFKKGVAELIIEEGSHIISQMK